MCRLVRHREVIAAPFLGGEKPGFFTVRKETCADKKTKPRRSRDVGIPQSSGHLIQRRLGVAYLAAAFLFAALASRDFSREALFGWINRLAPAWSSRLETSLNVTVAFGASLPVAVAVAVAVASSEVRNFLISVFSEACCERFCRRRF